MVLGEILTAIVTPFKADGAVDLDAFRALASHLVANGSDGLVVTGTTGESPTLSDDERFGAVQAALDGSATGRRSWPAPARNDRHSAPHDAEGSACTASSLRPTHSSPARIVEHFRAIAAGPDPLDRGLQHPGPSC